MSGGELDPKGADDPAAQIVPSGHGNGSTVLSNGQ
jgi:hypothetical protein